MMKSLSIDAETMRNLTEDEIKLLTVLGIPLKEKKKTEKALVHIPKEYDLVVTKVCRLCGHSEAKLYHMTVDWTMKGLVAVEVESVGDNYRVKNYHVRYCSQCRKYLKAKSIDEVIDILMEELDKRFLS